MLLGFQEGALEAPQAGVGDALFQHDVITHPAATATGLGGAGLASSRAASWRATQPSEAWAPPRALAGCREIEAGGRKPLLNSFTVLPGESLPLARGRYPVLTSNSFAVLPAICSTVCRFTSNNYSSFESPNAAWRDVNAHAIDRGGVPSIGRAD